jgi:hypothetical protein
VQSQDIPNGGTSSTDADPSAVHDGTPPHSVIVDPRLALPDSSPVQRSMTIEAVATDGGPAAPVIDPSLDASDDPDDDAGPSSDDPLDIDMVEGDAGHMGALSLKITQAAMEAVLESARRGSLGTETVARRSVSPHPLDVGSVEVNETDVYELDDPVEDEGEADLVAAGLIAEEDYHPSDPLDGILVKHMLDPGQ